MAEQGIDERAAWMPVRGMDHHAGGLVDDDEMFILKRDIERDGFCARLGGLHGRDFNPDGIARFDPVIGLHYGRAIDGDLAVADQALKTGTAEFRKSGFEDPVETVAGIVRFNGEFEE